MSRRFARYFPRVMGYLALLLAGLLSLSAARTQAGPAAEYSAPSVTPATTMVAAMVVAAQAPARR